MIFFLISISQADSWSDILTLRKQGLFEQEYRSCMQLQETKHSRSAQCIHRNVDLDLRRDKDGTFGCLKKLHHVQQSYATKEPSERWELVASLFESTSCRPVMRGDVLIWLQREGIAQKKETTVLTLFENTDVDTFSTQQQARIQDLHIDILARMNRWEEAKALEARNTFPRGKNPSEGLYQRGREKNREHLDLLAKMILGIFFCSNVPSAIWVIRNKGIGSWKGWIASCVLVAIFAVISLLHTSHAITMWASLGGGFVVIQWCTAHAWYAHHRFRYVFSVIGALGIFAMAWLILNFFGETSWIY